LNPITTAPIPLLQLVAPPEVSAEQPDDDHQLPPGKTITVIPASGGPSIGSNSPSGEDMPHTGEILARDQTWVRHAGCALC
jgi:hypothetical protein